ncbi:MAG: serine protease [Acidimicrobiales bacterium]
MVVPTRRVLMVAVSLAVIPALVAPADAHRRRARKPSTAGQAAPTPPAPPPVSPPTWVPASTAAVLPGVQTFTEGAQCTSNFVFTDAAGAVYLGQAAHCSGTGGPTATDGCDSASLPLGTPVKVAGASKPGILAYNSWITMQGRKEQDKNACQYNDLALVRLDPADVAKVNPSVPFFGGPTALATAGTSAGDAVYSYGNSGLRQGLAALSPKRGVSLGDSGGGWSHNVFTVSPGVPGDSGSAFLDATGKALGVLSTLQILPLVGSNGVGDLSRELAYLNAHAGLPAMTLAPGTEPFKGTRLL